MEPTEQMKRMKQLSLAETGFLPNAGKQPRKAVFLPEKEQVVPWSRLEGLVEPFYPKKGNGRPPMPLGLIHTVECTTAKVADITTLEACLHGDEKIALADRGYHKVNRPLEHFAKEGDLSVQAPTRKPAGGGLTKEQKAFNRMLSAVRAIVEHPFRVVKRQFGFVKVRYRGLVKNTGQIVTLFALANLWLARKRLLPLLDEVRP